LTAKIIKVLFANNVWFTCVILIALFSITIDGFFSAGNYVNIIYHSIFIGVLAIAEAYVMLSGKIDISIESTAACSGILAVWLCSPSQYASGLLLPVWLVFLIVILIGGLIGLINAFFITKFRIYSFLVTLSSYIFVRATAIWVTDGYGMNGLPPSFRFIDKFKIFNIPLVVICMLGLYILFDFILKKTAFGKHLYAVGENEKVASKRGINVNVMIYKVFFIAGALASLAGWFMAAKTNGATASMGENYIFEVLAATLIGGIGLSGGRGSLINVLAGCLILSSIYSALDIGAFSPFITNIITGVMILLAASMNGLNENFKLPIAEDVSRE